MVGAKISLSTQGWMLPPKTAPVRAAQTVVLNQEDLTMEGLMFWMEVFATAGVVSVLALVIACIMVLPLTVVSAYAKRSADRENLRRQSV
jgi:membrane protein implicated in regulation of membrane protease activity